MFKAPFSFSGRIRRTEYGLSILIYFFAILIMSFAAGAFSSANNSALGGLLVIVLFLPLVFFMLAQGVKRSHDLGNSGWFILIPFYGLWLLFAESKHGMNEYGPNPKGIGNDPEFAFEQENRQ